MKIKKFMHTATLTILLGSCPVILSGCHKQDQITYQEVIDYMADETNMDEIEDMYTIRYINIVDREQAIANNEAYISDVINLKEGIRILQNDLDIYEFLKKVDLDNQKFQELDNSAKKELSKFTKEDVKTLLEILKQEDINIKTEAQTYQKLNYIKEYIKEDILTNGLNICEAISKSSVKTIITDALDISAEDYKNITLTPIDSTAPSVIPVFYNDDNGYQKYYELKMENSYKYVYDIQNYQRRIDETVIEADFDNVL